MSADNGTMTKLRELVEAAWREGYQAAIDSAGFTHPDMDWNDSETKKALEAL